MNDLRKWKEKDGTLPARSGVLPFPFEKFQTGATRTQSSRLGLIKVCAVNDTGANSAVWYGKCLRSEINRHQTVKRSRKNGFRKTLCNYRAADCGGGKNYNTYAEFTFYRNKQRAELILLLSTFCAKEFQLFPNSNRDIRFHFRPKRRAHNANVLIYGNAEKEHLLDNESEKRPGFEKCTRFLFFISNYRGAKR